jgi:CHAT domain-containing protein
MTGAGATTHTVGPVLDGAALAHIAAHGIVRADNPLFSSLLLDDGPYTVYDIERLDQAPHHAVLAACNSAVSQITAGEEILGLAAALLSQQTATLVASVVPVPDAETVDLMVDYHQLLRQGRTPAAALAEAQQRHAGSPHARASAAGFVCLGAGHQVTSWLP